MPSYRIRSKGGDTVGLYQGESPAEALLAHFRDAGYGPDVVRIERGSLRFARPEDRERLGDLRSWSVELLWR